MTGKSVKLTSPDTYQYAMATAPLKAAGTTMMRVALRFSGTTGSHAKAFRLYNASTGHTVMRIDYHTDGHLYTYNGASTVDLGALAKNTWMDFAIFLDTSTKKFHLYVHHTRWPASPSTYDFENAEVPDRVEFKNNLTGENMWFDFVQDWSSWQQIDFDGEVNGNPPSIPPWTTINLAGPGSPYIRCDNSQINTNRWWSPAGVLSCKFHTGASADMAILDKTISLGDFNIFDFWLYTNGYEGSYSSFWKIRASGGGGFDAVGIWLHSDGHVYTRSTAGYIDMGAYPAHTWIQFTVFVNNVTKKFCIIREMETTPYRYPTDASTWYDWEYSVTVNQMLMGITPGGNPNDMWFDDIWYSLDAFVDDFNDDTTGAAPSNPPWVSDTTDPPDVLVVDTQYQGASGNSLWAWPGPSNQWARAYRIIHGMRGIFEVSTYLRFDTNKTSTNKRRFEFFNTMTGLTTIKVQDNSDGTLSFTNGAGMATGPSFNIDTWYNLVWHINTVRRTYHVTVGGVRFPTTGEYQFAGTGDFDAILLTANNGDCGIYLDTVLFSFAYILKDLEVSPLYPRKPIDNLPFLTVNISSLPLRWAFVGADAYGRQIQVADGEAKITVYVPRAVDSNNILDTSTDTELLDWVIDAVRESLTLQRYTISGIVKPRAMTPSPVGYNPDAKSILRSIMVRFQYTEAM